MDRFKQSHTTRNYVKKSKGKNYREKERKFTIIYGDYNEFSRVICHYKF